MPPPAPPPERHAGVELTGNDPWLRFEIYSHAKGANRKVPIHTCGNPCPVLLPHGEYRVRVSGGPKKVTGDRHIEVTGNGTWRFSLPDRSDRTSGLVLAITGTVLLPAGIGVVLLSAGGLGCSHTCERPAQRSEAADTGVAIGFGMILVGAALTPIGWSQFARNRKPKLEEPQQAARRKAAPRVGFGAAPVPGGATAAVWGRF